MNNSHDTEYTETVLRNYHFKQELRYVSRRQLRLMLRMWALVSSSVALIYICNFCAGLEDAAFLKSTVSEILILLVAIVLSFKLGGSVSLNRVERFGRRR